MRRDICILLYGTAGVPTQKLKTRLGRHYDDRIDPRQFRGALDALERTGHLTRETEGLQDVFTLTPAGQEAVSDHVEWLRSQLPDDAEPRE